MLLILGPFGSRAFVFADNLFVGSIGIAPLSVDLHIPPDFFFFRCFFIGDVFSDCTYEYECRFFLLLLISLSSGITGIMFSYAWVFF